MSINTFGSGEGLELVGICELSEEIRQWKKMVRAPCCEKMGLKKGPWTSEEDKILISHIQRYGHENWRALPKQAGLLRCGKSCRLRWINYLRPDIKRGNFSREEEETIIRLHELLGNRWSAIAARLPGRTDNEIKNVWHTHLKKRLKKNPATPENSKYSMETVEYNDHVEIDSNSSSLSEQQMIESPSYIPSSPQQEAWSDAASPATDSSSTTRECLNTSIKDDVQSADEEEIRWWEALSADETGINLDAANPQLQFPFSSHSYGLLNDDDMNFWADLYIGAGEWPELPEL